MSNEPTAIREFQGEYRWLSNFAPVTVFLDEVAYPSVEHAYQAAKTIDARQRAHILRCERPGLAKKEGRNLTLREDWDGMRVGIMRELLRQKFNDKNYRAKLLFTGDAEIVEGNSWGDTFWGVCRGEGANMLGKLIMEVRAELRR